MRLETLMRTGRGLRMRAHIGMTLTASPVFCREQGHLCSDCLYHLIHNPYVDRFGDTIDKVVEVYHRHPGSKLSFAELLEVGSDITSGAKQLAAIQDPNLDWEPEQRREDLVADQVHEILLVLEACEKQGFISEIQTTL